MVPVLTGADGEMLALGAFDGNSGAVSDLSISKPVGLKLEKNKIKKLIKRIEQKTKNHPVLIMGSILLRLVLTALLSKSMHVNQRRRV